MAILRVPVGGEAGHQRKKRGFSTFANIVSGIPLPGKASPQLGKEGWLGTSYVPPILQQIFSQDSSANSLIA
jgi:hypothetical protein